MMIKFDENEYILMAMFQRESRQATIDKIYNVIPYIVEDEEMLILINNTLEKLCSLSDESFFRLNLEEYRQEPMEDE